MTIRQKLKNNWFIGLLDKIWLLDFWIHVHGLHIFHMLRNKETCQMILIAYFHILPDDVKSSPIIRKTRQSVSVCILGSHLGSCVFERVTLFLNLFLAPHPLWMYHCIYQEFRHINSLLSDFLSKHTLQRTANFIFSLFNFIFFFLSGISV